MRFISWLLLAVLALAWFAPGATAQNGQPPADAKAAASEQQSPQGFFQILRAGGPVGLIIILLSVAAAALVLEHLMTIRAGVLMPQGLADQVREHLKAGRVGQALEQCKLQPCFLSSVLQAGLSEVDGKWTSLEKAMEDTTAEQSARLYRKIEYLSVIGNIAPMLGLLGTVIGMILAFQKVAATSGSANAADLAEGIYLALITTVEGLIVAIPCLAAFAVFRNRVDQLVAEAGYLAIGVFTPFKRKGNGPEPPPRDESYRGPVSRQPT